MSELTAADYSNQIAEIDKQIAVAIKDKEAVHQSILDLRRQKIELDVAISKARYNVDKLRVERSLAVHHFFNARNSGL